MHYLRWYRWGDPLKTTGRDNERRFWGMVEKTDDCWLWHGFRNRQNYGVFGHDAIRTMAHRYAYELVAGPVPEGLVLDHLCRNPPCVNPAHLGPITSQNNVRRGMALKTHCPQGHEYTPENTYRDPKGTHGRQCRTCMAYKNRARRHLSKLPN